mmetsp:Transcript_21254/g.44729  ORF Transcript_21254/g.44729 Transcript_21254/m.44729 type:complete len:108 (+) Transcript_21254:365-688(+)
MTTTTTTNPTTNYYCTAATQSTGWGVGVSFLVYERIRVHYTPFPACSTGVPRDKACGCVGVPGRGVAAQNAVRGAPRAGKHDVAALPIRPRPGRVPSSPATRDGCGP